MVFGFQTKELLFPRFPPRLPIWTVTSLVYADDPVYDHIGEAVTGLKELEVDNLYLLRIWPVLRVSNEYLEFAHPLRG